MRALWVDGPYRGQITTLRARQVYLEANVLGARPAWSGGPLQPEEGQVPVNRLRFTATVYAVGDRAWRVLVQDDEPKPEQRILLALIDAHPDGLAMVEVGV